ncbi:MAG: OmpA family protein [Bacteroidota bacterium]
MKKTTLLFTILVFSFLSLKAQISPSHIYFPSDVHELNISSKKELKAFLKEQVLAEGLFIEIVGHTDDLGEPEYNLALAFRRANAVKDFLLKKGIAEEQILLAALGEDSPMADNRDESGRKLNRRVSLALGDGSFVWLGPDASSIIAEENIEELNPREQYFQSMMADLRKKGKRYTIEPHREFRIETDNGTLLFIPAEVFETQDGSEIQEDIVVEVNEFIERSEMVLGGLHSISDQGLLETGGMFEINAYSGAKKLKLKEGRKIEVYVPTARKLDGMQLFGLGAGRNTETTFAVWQVDEEGDMPDSSRVKVHAEKWWLKKKGGPKWTDHSKSRHFIYQTYDTTWQNGVAVIIEHETGYNKPRPVLNALRRSSKPFYYRLNVGRLGWINCDRFYRYEGPKSELLVKLEDTNQPFVLSLVFKDMNSIMSPNYREGEYLGFGDIPLDRELVLIAMTKLKGKDKWKFAIQEVDFQEETLLDELEFQEGSKRLMETMIANRVD